MKLGMKVDLRTEKSEKYQKSGYLDNRCYGDQKTFSQLKYSLYLNQNLVGRSAMDIEKIHKISVSMVTKRCHGNQKGVSRTKNVPTAQIFPTYQSKHGREVGEGHRKKSTKYPFPW